MPRVSPARACEALAIAFCLLSPGWARAGNLSGEVSVASQLVDRGLAITPAAPALQGAVAWTTTSGWSLGLSGGVDMRSPGHVAAIVARVARSQSLSGNWRMQTGVLYYHYDARLGLSAYEPGVYWSFRDLLTFGVSCAYVTGLDKPRLHPAADLNFHWPLGGQFSISGGLGVTRYTVGRGHPERYYTGYYRYGQLGLLWSHGGWRVELDRVVVDSGNQRFYRGWAASPWLATIARSF